MKKLFKLIIIAALLFGLGSAVVHIYTAAVERVQVRRNMEARQSAWRFLTADIARRVRHFNGTAGIVIKDLDAGLVIRFNDRVALPAASIVKVPIMAACFYARAEGRIRFDQKIALQGKYKVGGSGKLKACRNNSVFTVGQLIDLMITESDNTATNIIIDLLGYDYLNATFKRMGLKETVLVRKMMDFSQRKFNVDNYTSARDIAMIIEKIYRGTMLDRRSSMECLKLLARQHLRDRIPALLPAHTVVAHKTGLENGICHDAGIVFTPKGNFLICVLTRHPEKTAKNAKAFIALIARDVYQYYQNLPSK